MLGDVATHRLLVVGSEQVADAVGDAEQADAEGLAGRAGHAGRLVDVLDEETDEGVEVRRIPFAFHVAFGEADVGREHDASEGVLVRDLEPRTALGLRVAEDELRAFGETQREAALGELREFPEDEAAGEGRLSHVVR